MGDEVIYLAIHLSATRFGYFSLKPCQESAVKAFVSGNDVFVSVPTGYGKSFCYCCLPWVFDFLTGKQSPYHFIIVVSPLIALMKDQIKRLCEKDLSAIHVQDKFDDCDDRVKSGIGKGVYSIVFTSPELILGDKSWVDIFRSNVLTERLVGLVIDEAHCIKKWGKQFRKEYACLGELRGLLHTSANIMALTATATKQTRKDICKSLSMVDPVMILKSPEKSNIIYKVIHKMCDMEETFAPLTEELRKNRKNTDKTIVFCRTYEDTSHIYLYFKSMLGSEMMDPVGFPDVSKFRMVDMFTACTTMDVKEHIIRSFVVPDSRLRIVVSTIAFGMGMDCPNIHRIIHWGPPPDLESYIQETGRAGRDGNVAHVVLYYSKKDISYDHIDDNMRDYCNNKLTCRRTLLFQEFDTYDGHKPNGCLCCDVCTNTCCCGLC